jgi:hypothetical protein
MIRSTVSALPSPVLPLLARREGRVVALKVV